MPEAGDESAKSVQENLPCHCRTKFEVPRQVKMKVSQKHISEKFPILFLRLNSYPDNTAKAFIL